MTDNIMQVIPDVVKYEKPRGRYPLGFSKHNDFRGIIMSEYIVLHGIRIAKDYKDFTPETFGRLTTIGPKFRLSAGNVGQSVTYQVCECSCGVITMTIKNQLSRGKIISCGCQKKEMGNRFRKHGLYQTAEYRIFHLIIQRCYNKNNSSYVRYGRRGITVCDRWLEPDGQGFLNFLADMGPRPSPKHSIDRVDNDGNYCPDNCCWATQVEQARNKRNNHNITYNGKSQCIAAWADEVGIAANTILNRLRRGWSIEAALTVLSGGKIE